MYHKILIASDGSEHSRKAAERAVFIASSSIGAELEIVYVVDEDEVRAEVLNNWSAADVKNIRENQLMDIESLVKKANIDYQVKILHGDPGPVIVKYANENQFDLVVIGSSGLNKFQEFVLGSVSQKVAKRSNSSVLIAK
ncbi:universal stress protein [Gracilibacillus sp. S3-1-1]|uniref:Universal stress protein n=1 Tax=Gracilibacillus pellucidus TaxID=3095368 RepID=A0ACC6M3F9_9BACI|nr:universal stress protein [Gracilibacillus sp. S3-1-1]MDX8045267.1 universal stress protein [Gracilibacillus sp. S3-1-1]